MKLAIVYDWLDKTGGAERLLQSLDKIYPEAHWYSSHQNKETAAWSSHMNVKTSFMQKLPSWILSSRIRSMPFYPFAFESFNLNGYDVVLSIGSTYAKAIITRPETKHVSYVFAPNRFLWGKRSHEYKYAASPVAQPYASYLKKWDLAATQRPDTLLTLSKSSQKGIKKYYKRDSNILYPPFDYHYWESLSEKAKSDEHADEPYYLVVSRLEPYKKINIAIEACNKLQKKLVIVGDGSLEKSLKETSSAKVTFKKNISDLELAKLYTHAQAHLMPQEEDFGYTSLEAQAIGCPVIAYKKGGALETIADNKTGLFFNNQNAESLASAIEKFEALSYTLVRSVKREGPLQVKQFSKATFKKQILNIL